MGNVTRPQLRTWLTGLLAGTITADAYFDNTMTTELQPQVQTMMALKKDGSWDDGDYQKVKAILWAEHYPDKQETKAGSMPERSYDPFAVRPPPMVYDPSVLEAYRTGKLSAAELAEALGAKVQKIAPAKGNQDKGKRKRTQKAADPLRGKSGQFLWDMAELWSYNPATGLLQSEAFVTLWKDGEPVMVQKRDDDGKRVFADVAKPNRKRKGKKRQGEPVMVPKTDKDGNAVFHQVKSYDGIAAAGAKSRTIQATWQAQGMPETHAAAWVKIRIGTRKVSQGEKTQQEGVVLVDPWGVIVSPETVLRLHSQAVGQGVGKVGELLTSATYQKMVEYTGRFLSGGKITNEYPTLADLVTDGDMVLAGHRKKAYQLLLSADGVDRLTTIKYVVCEKPDGRWCTTEQYAKMNPDKAAEYEPVWKAVTRGEAFDWDQGETEDKVLAKLSKDFRILCGMLPGTDGVKRCTVTDADREIYLQKRYARLDKIDPIRKEKAGPVCHTPNTRVDYNSDGTHNWGGTKGGKSGGKCAGAGWISNMYR